MSDETEPLQFDQAEYSGSADSLDCAVCNNPIGGEYYSVNGQATCVSCSSQFGGQDAVDSGPVGRFIKASLFGFIAAVIGTTVYFGVVWLTGYEIGLIAIAVGWLVGFAVYAGSDNRGGLVYQILAVVLTYVSICASFAPLAYQEMSAEADGEAALSGLFLWIILIVFSLALPFLSGFENIIGILIIGFGLYQAWQGAAAKHHVVEGPFAMSSGRSTMSSSGLG
jgi:hypothetical protein